MTSSKRASSRDVTEEDRWNMSLHQPQTVQVSDLAVFLPHEVIEPFANFRCLLQN